MLFACVPIISSCHIGEASEGPRVMCNWQAQWVNHINTLRPMKCLWSHSCPKFFFSSCVSVCLFSLTRVFLGQSMLHVCVSLLLGTDQNLLSSSKIFGFNLIIIFFIWCNAAVVDGHFLDPSPDGQVCCTGGGSKQRLYLWIPWNTRGPWTQWCTWPRRPRWT